MEKNKSIIAVGSTSEREKIEDFCEGIVYDYAVAAKKPDKRGWKMVYLFTNTDFLAGAISCNGEDVARVAWKIATRKVSGGELQPDFNRRPRVAFYD